MSTAVPSNGESYFPYSIVHIPHEDDGIRKHIDDYKAFRLLSLELAPNSFASTWAIEEAFTDDVWYGRLSNPKANTFMAVAPSLRILSVSTVLGPLLYGTDVLPPIGNPWATVGAQPAPRDNEVMHFRLNAIFTLPGARRRGISKALIAKCMDFIKAEVSSKSSRQIIFSVVVEADNIGASALCKSFGFVEIRRVSASASPVGREFVLLEYKP